MPKGDIKLLEKKITLEKKPQCFKNCVEFYVVEAISKLWANLVNDKIIYNIFIKIDMDA
jgi:hypothetical protein